MQIQHMERKESLKLSSRLQMNSSDSGMGFHASLFSMIQGNPTSPPIPEGAMDKGPESRAEENSFLTPAAEKPSSSIRQGESNPVRESRETPTDPSLRTTVENKEAATEPQRSEAPQHSNCSEKVAPRLGVVTEKISTPGTPAPVSNQTLSKNPSAVMFIREQGDAVLSRQVQGQPAAEEAISAKYLSAFAKAGESAASVGETQASRMSAGIQLPLFKETTSPANPSATPSSNGPETQADSSSALEPASKNQTNKIPNENNAAKPANLSETKTTENSVKSSTQPVVAQAQGAAAAPVSAGDSKGAPSIPTGSNLGGTGNSLGDVSGGSNGMRPGAAEQSTISQRISQIQEMLSKTGGSILRLAHGGGGKMTLRLDPPAMGRLQVEVEIIRGVCHARILADDPAVKSSLMQGLPQLREALESQGVKLEGFTVDDHSQMSSFGKDAAQQREGRLPERQHLRSTVDSVEPEIKSDTQGVNIRSISGGIDLHI